MNVVCWCIPMYDKRQPIYGEISAVLADKNISLVGACCCNIDSANGAAIEGQR